MNRVQIIERKNPHSNIIFGSKVFVLDKNPQKGKFDSRSEGIFIGYSNDLKIYRVWLSKSRKLSCDVKFLNKSAFGHEY